MTRKDAMETLHDAVEYLKPEAMEWLYSEQENDYGSGIWDAYFMLDERLTEMEMYDLMRED